MLRREIDFLGNHRLFLILSITLVVVAVGSLLARGLTFGIEFQGGTVINISHAEGVSIDEVRGAFADAGAPGLVVQSTEGGGYIVRSTESDADVANDIFREVFGSLGLSTDIGDVSTIGPGWGRNITRAALLALAAAVLAILLYISVRYEYKMSVVAVLTLVHDVLIVLGIYALVGREVTPNTIAALLTIMGYSLYDTIVVFHRIRENSMGLTRSTFTVMANHSLNQVIARSINTSITSIIPPLMLLFFGGETLGDFAFALVVGIVLGAYSSIGVATPLYTAWKEREPKFRALAKKFGAA
ncbi:MAG: protein translocase subunit SecF [Anaerosomatales bacterium]|nr:protein translocase subunit SecF [Anaerosomatales bacterium]MDT8433173.1 protein translocase subunit SecF [Anaerosomatales bacterium]